MKKVILAMAFAFGLVMPGFAQVADEEPSDIDTKAAELTERLTQKLALSEDQREDIYEATVDMLEEKSEKDKTRGEIQKEYDETLAEILNDEQYQQYMEGEERTMMMENEKHKQDKKMMKTEKKQKKEVEVDID